MRPVRGIIGTAAVLAVVALAVPSAHEIPRSVTVHAFVKPEAGRLRVLIRAPLGAMRDIQFPQVDGEFLDLAHAESALRDAATMWLLPGLELFEAGTRMGSPEIVAVRASLPSDRSFVSVDAALAHMTAPPLPNETRVPWQQAMLDVLLEYRVESEGTDLSIRPGFERLAVDVVTLLRFVHPRQGSVGTATVRVFELRGDPGVVRLDPRWHQAAWGFVKLGFFHVLDGFDHLLFLVCLVVPFRRVRPLIFIVTAFTIAHSITLIAAAAGFAPDGIWFPPLVETLIAASILYMAIENVVAGTGVRRRALMAFGFGLVHGFGFSFVLGDTMQFAGSHLLTSLLSFNVGVEIAQIAVLLALVPALQAVFQRMPSERALTIVLSALIGHMAWHWMADRWSALRQVPVPELDSTMLIASARVLLGIAGLVAAVWAGRRFQARITSARTRTAGAGDPSRRLRSASSSPSDGRSA